MPCCAIWARKATARSFLSAAAAISAPLDLAAGGAALSQGFNLIYTRMFLQTLKRKSLAKLDQFPGLFDRATMLASRDLYAFDNVVTAPLHGFRDTDDYWMRAASKPVLGEIRIPTLVLNARNDPFLPGQHLPSQAEVSPDVLLEQPRARRPRRLHDAPRRRAGPPAAVPGGGPYRMAAHAHPRLLRQRGWNAPDGVGDNHG